MLFFNNPEAIKTISNSRRQQDGQNHDTKATTSRPTFHRRSPSSER